MSPLPAMLHEPHFQRRWRLLLAVLAGITAWFAFMPGVLAPQVEGADKINHLLAFGALASAATLSLGPGPRQSLVASAGLLLYGAVIELVQSRLPTRHGDWADVLADAVGIACGVLLVALMRRTWRRPVR